MTIDMNATNRTPSRTLLHLTVVAIALSFLAGCRTGPSEYLHNGFKVGPNYRPPAAPVSDNWIDYRNAELVTSQPAYWDWWRVFNDPHLELIVQRAYSQNLTLRTAGFRIQEARARRAVVAGSIWPQSQTVFGSYRRQQISTATGITAGGGGGLPGVQRAFDVWQTGGQFSWELDFWGRFRRAITSADAELDASVENYDDVLVVLIGDVAQAYMEIRLAQQRIRYAEANAKAQVGTVEFFKIREKVGVQPPTDSLQALSNLSRTQAVIPQLETDLRRAENRLCILLGIPPQDLEPLLNNQMPIPEAPPLVALGVPADLLRRRPDVRRAERLAAAQSERIGIQEAAMYPAFFINGTLFVQATQLNRLFTGDAVGGNIGPSFSWNLLNYGRIWNATNAEEALFMQRVTEYQNEVLNAQREAEDAIAGFLNAQEQAKILRIGVDAAIKSRNIINDKLINGAVDYNELFVADLFLTQQQDELALAQGAIAINLVETFRALGGGWELRTPQAQGPITLMPGQAMAGQTIPQQPVPEPLQPNAPPNATPNAVPNTVQPTPAQQNPVPPPPRQPFVPERLPNPEKK